tara:strand:+ start:306 stop:446 length:141 start_codon:yes stop_codon:yes gene_type:complete
MDEGTGGKGSQGKMRKMAREGRLRGDEWRDDERIWRMRLVEERRKV